MVDMATILREQIYSAVRAFTCATVAEAEAATKVIIRLVDNALPDDGTCVRCGAAPRNETGLCATCRDEDTCSEALAMSKCGICGEPMPPGEEMFKMHGYSGDCPKPPVPKPKIAAVIEYVHRQEGGQFWLDIVVDREPWQTLGPFDTAEERQCVHDDLMAMMRSAGARDLPLQPQ